MSNNNYWEDEDDDFEFENQPQISKEEARFRDLRKAKKSDEKRIKELTEKLESLTKAQSERTVKEVLEKKGVNPKAARLIPNSLDLLLLRMHRKLMLLLTLCVSKTALRRVQ
jgi:CRISPR/Cas system-associated protein Cas10 (large subunit of type III CRISPR-Cas system)